MKSKLPPDKCRDKISMKIIPYFKSPYVAIPSSTAAIFALILKFCPPAGIFLLWVTAIMVALLILGTGFLAFLKTIRPAIVELSKIRSAWSSFTDQGNPRG